VRKRTLENNVGIKIYSVALEYRDQDCAVRRRTGVYAGVSCLPAEVVQGNGGRSAALRMTLLHELDSQPRQHRPTRPHGARACSTDFIVFETKAALHDRAVVGVSFLGNVISCCVPSAALHYEYL
jgi:hypothetical protein